MTDESDRKTSAESAPGDVLTALGVGPRGTRWRRLAAVLLVVFGVPLTLVGVFLVLFGIATLRVGDAQVPIDRRTDIGLVLGAAFVAAVGIAQIVSAAGLLRRRRWAAIVALAVSTGALAISLTLIPQAFPIRGQRANPNGPGFINDYDSGFLWYAIPAIAYGLTLLGVLVAERRDPQFDLRRRPHA